MDEHERTMRSSNAGWITRVTVEQEQYDSGPFNIDGPLDDVIASLVEFRESIPEGSRASATCEIDNVRSYEDSCYARITVAYDRPATGDEIAAAKSVEKSRRAEMLAHKRAELQRLKAELGE